MRSDCLESSIGSLVGLGVIGSSISEKRGFTRVRPLFKLAMSSKLSMFLSGASNCLKLSKVGSFRFGFCVVIGIFAGIEAGGGRREVVCGT